MTKSTIDKENARMYLKDVEPLWRAFWFHMHLMAKNLAEFADGLGTISDEVFDYHVSGQKNDLARWAREVIGDAELSQRLSTVSTKEEAAAAASERLAELRKLAG